MAATRTGWLLALWRLFDERMHALSKSLQKAVRSLRVGRALLWTMVLLVYAAAGVAIWRPEWTQYALAVIVVGLSLPLVAVAMLVGLPLRAKSVVRLIDKGYPENTRELVLRIVVRKLHEESIETEELLAETVLNETRKAVRKYKPRLLALLRKMDEEDEGGAQRAGRDPPGP